MDDRKIKQEAGFQDHADNSKLKTNCSFSASLDSLWFSLSDLMRGVIPRNQSVIRVRPQRDRNASNACILVTDARQIALHYLVILTFAR